MACLHHNDFTPPGHLSPPVAVFSGVLSTRYCWPPVEKSRFHSVPDTVILTARRCLHHTTTCMRAIQCSMWQ
jgi:hypothetical protein